MDDADGNDDGRVRRELRVLRWGLVPSWAKDPKAGSRMINARVETVHEKPAYRRAFAKRRCLLPADGFYEWDPVTDESTGKTRKQPYFIHPGDGEVMALAGLYEYWRNPDVPAVDDPDAWLVTCTIITTEATDEAGRIHPRMPLALTPEHYDTWLDPTHQDTGDLRALLTQPAGGRLETRAVSTAVNNVRNDGPRLLDATT
jgi:putative SOS response-associated peptidase YedK